MSQLEWEVKFIQWSIKGGREISTLLVIANAFECHPPLQNPRNSLNIRENKIV